jgi:hypothetical protein
VEEERFPYIALPVAYPHEFTPIAQNTDLGDKCPTPAYKIAKRPLSAFRKPAIAR